MIFGPWTWWEWVVFVWGLVCVASALWFWWMACHAPFMDSQGRYVSREEYDADYARQRELSENESFWDAVERRSVERKADELSG